MAKMYLNKAMAKGAMLEMERDEKVIVLGEDLLNRGGGMSNLIGVPNAFPDRCFDMPIAENAFANMAVGAAMLGMKPIVDLMFSRLPRSAPMRLSTVRRKCACSPLGKQKSQSFTLLPMAEEAPSASQELVRLIHSVSKVGSTMFPV